MPNNSGKSVLLTGGAGFIGHHLTKRLLDEGYRVKVFDNLYRANENTVQELREHTDVELIEGDVRYYDQVEEAMSGVDLVSHQAAVCINKSVSAPLESLETNLVGSANVFQAAARNKVDKVVFASSASVYGDPLKLPMAEDDTLKPITPYCIAKEAIEHLAEFYRSFHGLNYTGLRYFNVYGPRQPVDAFYTNVVVVFIKRILNGEAPVIQGNGEQSMDFIHVDDIVAANMSAISGPAANLSLNVGTGISTTIRELAEVLLEAMGRSDLVPEYSGQAAMVSRRAADIQEIKARLGWEPKISASKGLKEVGLDIMEHPEEY